MSKVTFDKKVKELNKLRELGLINRKIYRASMQELKDRMIESAYKIDRLENTKKVAYHYNKYDGELSNTLIKVPNRVSVWS